MTDRFFSIGVGMAIFGTFLFALKSIIIKLAYAAGANADILLAQRMLLAVPFYAAMLVWLYRNDNVKEKPSTPLIIKILALGFLGYYLASYLDLKGLEYISAQLERLTLFTYPAIIAVLAWLFLGEQMTWRIVFALVMCYLGIFVMYSQEKELLAGADVETGVLLVMGSALSFSLYVLFAKPVMQRIGSRAFTSIAMIGSTGFVLIHFGVLHSWGELQTSWLIWGYALLLAFVSTVIPSFLVSEAIVRIGATRTTILGSIGPVFTMILAIVLLSEPSSWWHVAGMVLVVAGVFAVSKKT